MKGKEFIEGVKRRLAKTDRAKTDRQVAEYLGITVTALNNWRERPAVTVRQMVGLLARVEEAAAERTEKQAIRPIVEFFPVTPPKGRGRVEIFGVRDGDGGEHPYLKGLREELEEHRGIYLFHDSRGRALYAGKARRQSLWKEINFAFNRHRQVQKIRRVKHPERRQGFRTSEEMRRQIRLRAVQLHELASYLSAYQVADGLIGELESLLIRGFPNDLLNVRMEKFRFDGE